VNTRLWYFFQAAAQDSPATYGIAPELYAPGGWELWWRSGIRGSPPGEVLSECGVPLIIQNWTGQVPGKPTQCRIEDLPNHYMIGIASILERYSADIVLHCGAIHNSIVTVDNVIASLRRWGISASVAERFFSDRNTYWCQDAAGEALPRYYGDNLHLAKRTIYHQFAPAIEGGTPDRYTGIMPVSLNLWQRSALLNMVNNPKAREGIAPLDENVENVVWIDDATLATPEEHVFAAEQVKAGGVLDTAPRTVEMYGINWTVADGKPDAFQQSAARPLSAAISVGMKAEQVREIWGGGK